MEKKFLDESTLTYLRNYIDGQDKVIYKAAADLITAKKCVTELYLNITEFIGEMIEGSTSTTITREGFNLIQTKLNNGEIIGISIDNILIQFAYSDKYSYDVDGTPTLFTKLIFIYNFENKANLKYTIDGRTLTVTGEIETRLNIPALPADAETKTYTLQAVNGVLTWTDTIGEINTVLDNINGEEV